MKARFWVVSGTGYSLRGSLNDDLARDRERADDRAKYPVRLQKELSQTRSEGWSWVHSRNSAKGAVRYRWNSQLKILECWAVTKGGNRPFQLIGEFVESVLHSQGKKVRSIHIEVG